MDKDNELNLNFPTSEEWQQITCPHCKSPFHEAKDCPQSQTGESKFKFQTRKEMGLKGNALPFKFQVDIDPKVDDDVEISRKRALLRLNSSKVYSLMGFSVKAHESQKAALQWLLRLADELDVDDKELQAERDTLLPIIQTLQETLQKLSSIRQTKIKQAEAMEETATKARVDARRGRHRIIKQRAQDKEFWMLRLPDSNVDIPLLYDETDIDSPQLLKEAADAILEKEKDKIREKDESEG